MKFVLIVVWVTFTKSPYSETQHHQHLQMQEFQTRKACERAEESIKRMFGERKVSAECVWNPESGRER